MPKLGEMWLDYYCDKIERCGSINAMPKLREMWLNYCYAKLGEIWLDYCYAKIRRHVARLLLCQN